MIPKQHKKYFTYGLITVGILFVCLGIIFAIQYLKPSQHNWQFESIDTMKYSRDLAREELSNKSFGATIDRQVQEIAGTGATHIAIATPYDAEFLPMLKRWVKAARKYNLKVWFRGNFSGWEGWFDYPKITRVQHLKMTKEFIQKNADIFEDGDVFTPCPECENGGPGDPRQTGDVVGHRKFLVDEYSVTKFAFKNIKKKVASNYDSMNMDVAKQVMDKPTTKALDGIVTVDHYVKDPKQLRDDIADLARISEGKVILGEFGAPVPEITGPMSELEQYEWISHVLMLLQDDKNLIGLSYWVGEGGSTELWDEQGKARAAVTSISKYYKKEMLLTPF